MNEYISRDKVLNKFIEGDGHDDDRFTEGYNFAVQEHREEVENIPAADVQPVKYGRWIGIYEWAKMHDSRPIGMCTYFWCSECQTAQEKKSNFCPNCGARMDGEAQC